MLRCFTAAQLCGCYPYTRGAILQIDYVKHQHGRVLNGFTAAQLILHKFTNATIF
jgi:hypothetical protein